MTEREKVREKEGEKEGSRKNHHRNWYSYENTKSSQIIKIM